MNQQLATSYPEPDHLKKVTDIELLNPIHDWYFGHTFMQGPYQSQALSSVDELLSQIDPLSVYRINANFTVQQEKRGRSFFHIDYDRDPLNNNISMFTSIFYINTTNGPTILEDGTEIECRANRLVTYPYNTYHAGVLCTDQPYRIVVNFNYFIALHIFLLYHTLARLVLAHHLYLCMCVLDILDDSSSQSENL